jgi:hypothetical protein
MGAGQKERGINTWKMPRNDLVKLVQEAVRGKGRLHRLGWIAQIEMRIALVKIK